MALCHALGDGDAAGEVVVAVGLHRTTTAWRLDRLGRRGFRRSTWREGTKDKRSSKFYAERVVLAQDDGSARPERHFADLFITVACAA
ncbi:MAG: hypothetical protein PHU25_20685 [Deltaproteobacteria bacterium]|nr:hypothetical protein [Deltaproteobacteria bacterium]